MKPWIKASPYYDKAQLPLLSGKVSFVKIDPADWKLPCNNQSMSSLVFSVSLYTSVKIYTASVGNEEISFILLRCLFLPLSPTSGDVKRMGESESHHNGNSLNGKSTLYCCVFPLCT